jgi:hypothetical protein
VANRILWNRRPTLGDNGCIDEVVLHDVDTVHIEQMDDCCWCIGISKADGTYWSGNFVTDERGHMSFIEQESDVKWENDASHNNSKEARRG